ncbi:MAG TPA: hypothetical protein VES20_15500 [Bryobacteraceae bacterium]|nr:hypothetical protein [Bryobacteraceae bacterium]
MIPPDSGLLFITCALAIAGAIAGVFLSGISVLARRTVTASGAMLLVFSLAGVLPELGETYGWPQGPLIMVAAVACIWAIDRFVYPVCPACSPTHDHHACSTRLHGFAGPLIFAALLHSVFDGWSLLAVEDGSALSAGILIHKVPESFAFGALLRAALRSRVVAVIWAVAAQSTMLAGGAMAQAAAPVLGPRLMGLALAIGGGTFLYLGFHAIHGEWRRRTAARAVRIG